MTQHTKSKLTHTIHKNTTNTTRIESHREETK